MIALKIAEVKDFMNKLLCQDVFDHFLIQEAVITTNVSCHIDGTLQKDFYTLEELEEQNLTGAFLCSVWSFAQFLLQPDQRKENSFLFQVFPPVIAGKSQTHPLPDRKFLHGK